MWVLYGLTFMFSNAYQLDLQNKSCAALPNPQWNICKNRIEMQTFLNIIMVIGNLSVLISKLGT